MNQCRLIVNADDFGFSKGVTDGIVTAHLEGVVTSTSMMANMPASEYAAEVHQKVPSLAVGAHLVLSQGRPILPPERVPSLVTSDGCFYSYAEVISRLSRWKFAAAEIEAEFRAQLQWLRAHGVQPTHADSHHHVHLYPSSIGPYRAALMAEGVKSSRAPRHWSYPSKGWFDGPHGGGKVRKTVVAGYMAYLQYVNLRPFTLPDLCVTAHPAFQRSWKQIGEGWTRTLRHLPDGAFELGCHPGVSDELSCASDEIAERREIELGVLTGQQMKDVVRERGIRLIQYGDLQ